MSERLRRDTFIAVYSVGTIEEISELFRADYRDVKNDMHGIAKAMNLFQKYVLSITFMYTITTMKTNLTLFRNIIRAEGGIHEKTVMEAFKIFDIYTVIKDRYEDGLKKKELNSKPLAFDVSKEITRVRGLLSDDSNWERAISGTLVKNNQNPNQVRSYYIAYLLGLGIGRRFTEATKTIKITKSKGVYFFTGILKKEKTEESKIEAYFLDITATEAKGYIKELRAFIAMKLKDKNLTLTTATENDINRIFSKVFNNAVKRISEGKILNTHELRHYYAIEHQNRYLSQNPSLKTMDSESLEEHLGLFRRKVLGHKTVSDSTRPYKTIK